MEDLNDKKMTLKNYRCFEDYTINFKDETLIVGENNAGKSTIIEALRIISVTANKLFKNRQYINANDSLNIHKNIRGFNLNLDAYKIDLRSIVYFYKENINAEIIAEFENNVIFKIYLNPECVFATIYNKNGENIKSITNAKKMNENDLKVNIMPHLNLIREKEKKLATETIERDQYTYLSSLHFRNEILLYKNDYFLKFKNIAEKIWSGLCIDDVEYSFDNDEVLFWIKDNQFPSELGLTGSGLQMYLQIIWFISKNSSGATIILDEPDVYLHPNLQKKIFNYIKSMNTQIIIATHSVELISEADFKNVFQIDKTIRIQRYSNGLSNVQNIVEKIGSVQNMSLLRLGLSKKCIFVEGLDMKLLNKFYKILYPEKIELLSDLPIIELGSFTRYEQALGVSKLFYKETEGNFKCICILDRDYRMENELNRIKKNAEDAHLNLHIWERKELESYLINPNVLYKFIKDNVSYEDFISGLNYALDSFYYELMDQYSNAIHEVDRSKNIQTTNQEARLYIDARWDSLDKKLRLINGKNLLSFIIKYMKEKYKVSINKNKILDKFSVEDVDKEIKNVIDSIIL